jgi:molybdopterin/thiamine biosynthesis adenylyltransferase
MGPSPESGKREPRGNTDRRLACLRARVDAVRIIVNRYHRQTLLPQIGQAGQDRLASARVLLIGCGALGTHVAEQLVRAGVGFLRIADRDIVETSNLQRQVLFDERDAERAWPKAAAAGERLGEINSSVIVDPRIVDVDPANIESLIADQIHLIIDGTDNVATRYLINDLAIKHNIPWIYGACIGVEGRVMTVLPGRSACLRCVFPIPPAADELPTCDTAGVLGPAAAIVGSLQAAAAIKVLTGNQSAIAEELLTLNLWTNRIHAVSLNDARRSDCVCCGERRFEFLARTSSQRAATLCGRDAVQVAGASAIELSSTARRWEPLGTVEQNRYFVRCRLTDPADIVLTLFSDGRLIVKGTRDPSRARSIYARFVGC